MAKEQIIEEIESGSLSKGDLQDIIDVAHYQIGGKDENASTWSVFTVPFSAMKETWKDTWNLAWGRNKEIQERNIKMMRDHYDSKLRKTRKK